MNPLELLIVTILAVIGSVILLEGVVYAIYFIIDVLKWLYIIVTGVIKCCWIAAGIIAMMYITKVITMKIWLKTQAVRAALLQRTHPPVHPDSPAHHGMGDCSPHLFVFNPPQPTNPNTRLQLNPLLSKPGRRLDSGVRF